MRFKVKAAFLLIIAILFLTDDAFSQRRRRNSFQKRRGKSKKIGKYRSGRTQGGASRFRAYQYVGFGVNALNYFGDLAPVNKAASTDISFTRPGFGIMYGYRFHPAMAARASFNWGILRGDDNSSDPDGETSAARYQRNLSFRNFVKELSLGMEFYILPNNRGSNARPPINGYIYLGVAGFHHQPQGQAPEFDYQTGSDAALPNGLSPGDWVNLKPLGTEGQNLDGALPDSDYSSFQLAVPIGLGGVFNPPGPLSFGVEFGYRFLFTDYLDDVSGNYVGLDRFTDPVARIFSDRGAEAIAVTTGDTRMVTPVSLDFNGTAYNINGFVGSGIQDSKRGNPGDDDMYFVTQIRVTYVLQSRQKSTAKFR